MSPPCIASCLSKKNNKKQQKTADDLKSPIFISCPLMWFMESRQRKNHKNGLQNPNHYIMYMESLMDNPPSRRTTDMFQPIVKTNHSCQLISAYDGNILTDRKLTSRNTKVSQSRHLNTLRIKRTCENSIHWKK